MFDDLPQNLKDQVLNTTGISTRSLFTIGGMGAQDRSLFQEPEGENGNRASNGKPRMNWVQKPCN